MTTPRRRLLRPVPERAPPDTSQARLRHRRQTQLDQERGAFDRWMTRLRRAGNELARRQKRIVRLERLLARMPSG